MNPQFHCLLPLYNGHITATKAWGSHKNTNAIYTKHISSPTSDKCLQQITSKCHRFQTIITVTVTTQPYHTVFHFHHSSLIITLYCTYEVDRPKSPPLLTAFSFMTTSPQLVLTDANNFSTQYSNKYCKILTAVILHSPQEGDMGICSDAVLMQF